MLRERLTPDRIRRFSCPADAQQVFLWDTEASRLAVRATVGAKAFIFESKLDRRTIRITIGDVRDWSLDDARVEARRLQTLVDQGIDPRRAKADRIAAAKAEMEAVAVKAVTFGTAWTAYVEARSPKWGDHYRRTHTLAVIEGGKPITRGRKKSQGDKTLPGMMYPLLSVRLADLDVKRVKAWLAECNARGPTQAALMFRVLRAFLNWCGEHDQYAKVIHADACSPREVREDVQSAKARAGAIQREQLPLWFDAVRKAGNPVMAAYLQTVLLTGARRGELLALKWQDVDFQWCSMTIRDKVEGERTIPLTPFVAELLAALPRRNDWVFSSTKKGDGRLKDPLHHHHAAMRAAGLPPFGIHDLRRSFGSLAEWAETPAGVVAQIMGHKPSATAEKHYRVRPLDLLRMWHTKIEASILGQAGIEQPPAQMAAALRTVV